MAQLVPTASAHESPAVVPVQDLSSSVRAILVLSCTARICSGSVLGPTAMLSGASQQALSEHKVENMLYPNIRYPALGHATMHELFCVQSYGTELCSLIYHLVPLPIRQTVCPFT